jgi:hypothetical protein
MVVTRRFAAALQNPAYRPAGILPSFSRQAHKRSAPGCGGLAAALRGIRARIPAISIPILNLDEHSPRLRFRTPCVEKATEN